MDEITKLSANHLPFVFCMHINSDYLTTVSRFLCLLLEMYVTLLPRSYDKLFFHLCVPGNSLLLVFGFCHASELADQMACLIHTSYTFLNAFKT